MSLRMVPYLNFDGTCAEAFRFYRSVLGGEFVGGIQTHGDSPIADQVPPEWHDRVLHVHLAAGDAVLLGSDTPPGQAPRLGGVHVSIGVDEPAEADRIFAALSQGGTVTMEIGETFWARRFGMFTDRFGIPWMVNCQRAQ